MYWHFLQYCYILFFVINSIKLQIMDYTHLIKTDLWHITSGMNSLFFLAGLPAAGSPRAEAAQRDGLLHAHPCAARARWGGGSNQGLQPRHLARYTTHAQRPCHTTWGGYHLMCGQKLTWIIAHQYTPGITPGVYSFLAWNYFTSFHMFKNPVECYPKRKLSSISYLVYPHKPIFSLLSCNV